MLFILYGNRTAYILYMNKCMLFILQIHKNTKCLLKYGVEMEAPYRLKVTPGTGFVVLLIETSFGNLVSHVRDSPVFLIHLPTNEFLDDSSIQVPATYVKFSNDFLALGFSLAQPQLLQALGRINQQVEDLSLSLSLCLSNKYIEISQHPLKRRIWSSMLNVVEELYNFYVFSCYPKKEIPKASPEENSASVQLSCQ